MCTSPFTLFPFLNNLHTISQFLILFIHHLRVFLTHRCYKFSEIFLLAIITGCTLFYLRPFYGCSSSIDNPNKCINAADLTTCSHGRDDLQLLSVGCRGDGLG